MTRSLRASEDGIKQIKKALKQAGFTQTELAKELGISRSTITVLLRGEAIASANFEELCKFLGLDWQDIRGEEVVSDDLELLVKEVKRKIAADVTDRCGTMRVLDMTQPVDLDRIYTDVNILKDVIGRRRISYDDVMEVCTREHFDRFLVGTIKERVTGFKAVNEIQKLVVLGKPGAGKTTFMKYLAMSCLGDRFHGELVPIFVTLKAYAEERGQPSLENYILTEFQKREVAVDTVKRLLKEGRALILLDGLDEVKKEDDRRIKQDIDQFSRDWLKNRFAITCRIAGREYQFENFTEVEVADFDDKQIKTFVNNWFQEKDKTKAKRLLVKLEDNEPVKELAKSPLFLTLLCLVFEKTNNLPEKQSELFKEGLDILLKIWDKKRDIERDFPKHFKGEQIYRNLSSEDKADMIGKIAFNSFVKGEYFFRQEDLQRQIKDYISDIPEISADPDVLRIDSEVVLKAIEHHHGLLVEQAKNIYSFSHLTFQEYFTAREIERDGQWETLLLNITDPRWSTVFLLTAEILRCSDDFFRSMKVQVDQLLVEDEKIQSFLIWAKQKSDFLQTKYKAVSVRAFYAYIGQFCHVSRNWEFVRDLIAVLDPDLDFDLNVNRDLDQDLSVAKSLLRDFDLDDFLDSNSNITLDNEIALDLDLARSLSRTTFLALAPGLVLYFFFDLTLFLDLVRAFGQTEDIGGDVLLRKLLKSYLLAILNFLSEDENIEESSILYWKNNGEKWRCELHQVCINRRNIGHDWQFTKEQVELLDLYYEANLFLIECMNRSYVSKEVREEIESTMLLPSKK